MRAERWEQIDCIFEAALERAPEERASLLDAECAGDQGLRREVESLLAAHEKAGDFIEAGAMELAAMGLAREQKAVGTVTSVGRRVGHYRIISLLGAGGMGEVYLALDARLGRRVALKLLPAHFTNDPERVRRFEREARAASALNHPNIVTIYDIGRADGVHYIAAEYVEGETLRRADGGARPKAREALGVAVQIADALAAAHAAGIVHRDVKPENIMVRPDGYVKVLDFGLAKLTEHAPQGDVSQGVSGMLQTGAGAVMGTVAYMSPEQALGQEVDCRTDIFSLGVVLYELTTGRHPFRGATAAATFDAILNREPSAPTVSNAELPRELERIIGRALEKDRELRYQTASDMRAELKRLQRALDSAAAVSGGATFTPDARGPSAPRLPRGLKVALASILVAASLAALFLASRPRSPEKNQAAQPTPPKNLNFTQLTDRPGVERFPSMSPDGKSFAYAADADGNWDVFVQRVGGRSPRNLTAGSSDDDTQPAFSPDGERIAFRSERQRGGIFVMGAEGESVKRLTDFGYHPAWSPDGREVAFSTHNIEDPNERGVDESVIWIVDVSTGARRQLTTAQTGDACQPRWSPAGARIAFWGKRRGGQRDLWTVAAAGGGEPAPLTDDAHFDWSPVWSSDGRFVYFSSNRGGSMNLWRLPVDEREGRAAGPPEPVTTPSTYAHHLSFSRDGRRAVFVNQVSSTNIFKADFNPYKEALAAQPSAVTRGFKHTASPDLSPDGEWFVYSSQGERQEDIFVVDKEGAGTPRQLTDDEHKDRDPRWSPDGRRIVFYSTRSGKYEAWTIDPDGSNLRQLTSTEGSSVAYPFWSPDGARVGYNRNGESPTIIDADKPWPEQTPRRLPLPPDRRLGPVWATSWSPDGRKLGGWALRTAEHPGVVVYTFETDSFERVSEFGGSPRWFADNRRLLFSTQDALFLVDSETKRVQKILSTKPHRLFGLGISKDNRTVYYGLAATESDVWLLNLE